VAQLVLVANLPTRRDLIPQEADIVTVAEYERDLKKTSLLTNIAW
jgi:hypothetical protein